MAITPSYQTFRGLSLPVSVKLSILWKPMIGCELLRRSLKFPAPKKPTWFHLLHTIYLEGAATIWWDNAKAMWPADDEITWDKFKDNFRKYHIPAGIMKVKQGEFLALTQGNMSVSEYLHKIQSLGSLFPL